MITDNTVNEIIELVENTLDFCGNSVRAVKQYCVENKIEYTDAIEAIIYKTQDNYFKHGI